MFISNFTDDNIKLLFIIKFFFFFFFLGGGTNENLSHTEHSTDTIKLTTAKCNVKNNTYLLTWCCREIKSRGLQYLCLHSMMTATNAPMNTAAKTAIATAVTGSMAIFEASTDIGLKWFLNLTLYKYPQMFNQT